MIRSRLLIGAVCAAAVLGGCGEESKSDLEKATEDFPEAASEAGKAVRAAETAERDLDRQTAKLCATLAPLSKAEQEAIYDQQRQSYPPDLQADFPEDLPCK